MAFSPTTEQKNAIFASSGTLVSAAAGSGKTAVLVERVIEKLCGCNPIAANRLLIVTFTNAAAEEMYSRIEKRLNEEYLKNPENRTILMQRYKLREANICTIDSFCINLVRENFEKVGISPDFTIADKSLLDVFSTRALNTVLNNAFESKRENFSLLLNGLSNDFDEANLKTAIVKASEFAKNKPFPIEWLKSSIEQIYNDEFENKVFNDLLLLVADKIKNNIINLNNALTAIKPLENVYEKYYDSFMQTVEDLGSALSYAEKGDWDGLFTSLNHISFLSYKTPNGFKDLAPVYNASNIRQTVKTDAANLLKLIYAPIKTVKEHYKTAQKMTVELLNLVKEYYEEFSKLRFENNTLSFDDTEHLALSLLCETNENGEVILKDSASETINRFDEVLVDEFQDTNDMQNLLFDILSDNQKKLFVVGDVKQSIYRFRGANPENFLYKKDTYLQYDGNEEKVGKKIILGKNFRSRNGICNFVNFTFTLLMNREESHIKYGTEEKLINGAEYPLKTTNDVSVIYTDIDNGVSDVEADAKSIAQFILNSIKNDYVTDKKTKLLRHPKFSDFTLLFRELSSKSTEYAKEFLKYGIPVSYRINGFLEFYEIQMILSILSIVENPTRDIELASVLMSPIFRFSADEMAEIRVKNRYGNLISALTESATTNKKCSDFLNKLKKYRALSNTRKISDLIHEIFVDTDILNIVSVLDGGKNRRKNLEFFFGLSIDYDNNGFSKNISSFIKYVDRLASGEIKAAGHNAGEDSITLMTVHSSKGLQFPICILADTVSKFNTRDYSDSILFNSDYGIGFSFWNENGTEKIDSVIKALISQCERQNQLEEEMRLLYVAFTRAEEKLAIFITDKNVLNYIKGNTVNCVTSESAEAYLASPKSFNSYAELITYALMSHPSMNCIKQKEGINGFFIDSHEKIDVILNTLSEINIDTVDDMSDEKDYQINRDLIPLLEENINFRYPFEDLREIESKAAAAIVAHKAETKDYSFKTLPAFMNKKGISPAAKGTAIHRFMQFCDFDKAKTDLLSEIDRLYDWEYITLTEKEAIDIQPIKAFFESELFSRITKAKRVEREMRFLTELPASLIKQNLSENAAKQNVVIQGSVDCIFEEDDGIIVVDFKTDRAKNPEDLIESYSAQLEIYSKACEKIFKKPVKQRVIYSFSLNKEIYF